MPPNSYVVLLKLMIEKQVLSGVAAVILCEDVCAALLDCGIHFLWG